MDEEKVQQLAETLKKNGLAASMSEAIDKAKSILNITIQKPNIAPEQNQDIPPPPQEQNIPLDQDYDITKEKVTLNELMKELNINPEQVTAEEREKLNNIKTEIHEIKEDIKEAEKKPEKIPEVKEEVEKVKEEVEEVVEQKTEEEPEETEKDRFKEEKKVDLTKVFGNKN